MNAEFCKRAIVALGVTAGSYAGYRPFELVAPVLYERIAMPLLAPLSQGVNPNAYFDPLESDKVQYGAHLGGLAMVALAASSYALEKQIEQKDRPAGPTSEA